LFDGIYWLVAPVIMPIIGGILGAVIYDALVTAQLPPKKE
jgi:glycerol uptake facilitator-like aquaporin